VAEGGYEFVIEALRAQGYEAKRGKFRCPGHNGEDANLGVKLARGDGSVALKCFSHGCSSEQILQALGLEKRHLFVHDPNQKRGEGGVKRELPDGMRWRRAKRYFAHNEKGQKEHFEDKLEPYKQVGNRWVNARLEAEALGYKNAKRVRQGRILANGDRVWGFDAGWYEPKGKDWYLNDQSRDADRPPSATAVWMKAGVRYLYNLPGTLAAIAEGRRVWLTEGPKDADALIKAGEVATTNFGGAKKWEARFTKMLAPSPTLPHQGAGEGEIEPVAGCGYELWIVRDKDRAGYERAAELGERLIANGINVRVCEAKSGKDVYEHLAAGYAVAEMIEIEDWRDGWIEPEGPSPGPPTQGDAPTLHVVTGGEKNSRGGSGGDEWFPRRSDGGWCEFAHTDAGNGRRFAHWFRGQIIWCQDANNGGHWLFWDGARWARDVRNQLTAVSMAKRAIDGMAKEAWHNDYRGDRSELLKWMVKSQEAKRIAAMVALARDEPGMNTTMNELDTHRDLIACKNGTLHLPTGELRPAEKSDMMTRLVPYNYDPDANSEHWAPFLDTITGGDAELKRFLWRAVGYSLTGHVREHCLFFLYGSGRNGKSTFVETISRILGQYSMTADSATLMVKDVKSQIRSDLARLKEARLVAMEETQKGARVDEGVVKWLTGGTSVVARPLYAAEIEFEPQWKFWVCGNHKPNIQGVDDGIWRRWRLIPFTQQIAEDAVDKRLQEKLMAEAPGILAWAVEGAKQWYRHGLAEPEKIIDAVNEYRDEMDVIGHFLRSETVIDNGGFLTANEIYERFKVWAKRTGSYPLSQKTLGIELKQRGLEHKKTNTGMRYLNIALRTEDEVTDE